jgi:hypothetical protein
LISLGPLIALCTLPRLAARLARRYGRRSRPYRRTVFCALLLGSIVFYWFPMGLPSDGEMIAHFRAHRDEFEEVVRRYRNYPTVRNSSHSKWMEEGDTKALMDKAGIKYVDGGGHHVWLPNPYTLETAKKVDAIVRDPENKTFAIFDKYGALRIKLSPEERYFARNPPRMVVVRKDYYHIPELPRIEDGWLLGPVNREGKHFFRTRVVASTNWFPLTWEWPSDCVLRPIEPHWFLRLCTGR